MKQSYLRQVELLLEILPLVMKETCFALKGGTALNLFVRDFPRLSVDIDLTFTPIISREKSMRAIHEALMNTKERIRKFDAGGAIKEKTSPENYCYALIVESAGAVVKIEPNTVLRGCLLKPTLRVLSPSLQKIFQMKFYMEVHTLDLSELYAGKITAALDRQHPRDLFDIKLLLENEGFTDEIREAFVVYLASHNRPMVELLSPILMNLEETYEKEFAGMIDRNVTLQTLEEARRDLVDILQTKLTRKNKLFLQSVKQGYPNWSFTPFQHLDQFPALQWKQKNIRKMEPEKHRIALSKLNELLNL